LNGRIIYRWNAASYQLDLQEKKASLVTALVLGNDFEWQAKLDDKGVRSIVHAGKEIGKWHVGVARTAAGRDRVFPMRSRAAISRDARCCVWHKDSGRCRRSSFGSMT